MTADSVASGQALNEQHKDRVKNWIPKLRDEFEREFRGQLNRLGLRESGKHEPLEEMSLPEDAVAARQKLHALLRREQRSEGSPEGGFASVERELAYTLLNRLVGLKVMESRGILYLPPPADPYGAPEQTEILTPVPGQQYSRYLRDFRAAGGNHYKWSDDADQALLRDALTTAFRFITQEIAILFDPEHEYASVWPTHAFLDRVIKRINSEIPPEAFRAPDFLGWVYQFSRQDLNDDVRKANKGTPQTSYELAIMNQFYTPGWIVKVLSDNTLGRLWLQMHPDSRIVPTRVLSEGERGPQADYLVPNTGEGIRYRHSEPDGSVATFKRVCDITLLDPACGTMHFGQYAFGLFQAMYEDEIEHAGEQGWPPEPSVTDRREIPAAIIENNLFGIDIDPRAIQIASLSLLMTAKEAALRSGYSPLDVKLRRTNLVVANAVELEKDRIRRLVDRIGGKGRREFRERLFVAIWDNLQNVSELGSLIQVRESVRSVLHEWVTERATEKGLTQLVRRSEEQRRLSFAGELDKTLGAQMDLERRLLEEEAAKIESELLDAVEHAAAQADPDPADHLFAEDTARGLKLLQILSRRFDVIVMNPPYGDFVPAVKKFARAAYPLSYQDIYAAFVDRATQLVTREGYIGALVSSSFMHQTTHEDFRTEILLRRNPLLVLLDLGPGILEATVNTAAIIVKGSAE